MQDNLLRPRLVDLIDMRHQLVKLAGLLREARCRVMQKKRRGMSFDGATGGASTASRRS